MVVVLEKQQTKRKTLLDVCEFIVDSEHKTAPTQDEGIPYIRTPNLGKGRFIFDKMRFISEETYQHWTKRATPQKNDLILGREAPVGNIAIVENQKVCLGQRTVLIRPNPEEVIPEYLLFLLLGDEIQGKFQSLSNGSTVHHLNMSDIRGLSLPSLPPKATQQKIAAILSAYDDLIENNTRRIAILEAMAQALYREWFVHFRYPGHGEVPLVDSPLGPIPQGWEVKAASLAIEINPRVQVSKDILNSFVTMDSLSVNSMVIGEVTEKQGNSGSKFKNEDTLFARITPCLQNGKTGFVQFLPSEAQAACGSTEFIVLRSKTLTPEFVYLLARTDDFRNNAIQSMSGATGRQRVHVGCFDKYMLANPDPKTLEKFSEITRPMFKQIHALSVKNKNLRQTRDLLLPRLISGQLDVSELEIQSA